MRSGLREQIYEVIDSERDRQDEKFGEINSELSNAEMLCVLVEEVGEAAKEINDYNINKHKVQSSKIV